MKKFFGGKKKKKSKPASFNSADSDFQANDAVPSKLIMSKSADQPRLSMINGTNNNTTITNTINNSNSNKGLMHSKSQGIMKTTIPTQPAMTKRLNRPTSSPPALVMPRPRYAEPPTRAVLKSFEHEKTLLDMDPTQLQQPLLTGQGGLESGNNDDEHGKRKVYGNNIGNPSAASLTIRFPIPSATVSTPSRSQKLSPTIDTDLLPQHDTKPVIRNKKSLDSGIAAVINTKKHESMNSITGSDDSNRVYESALESPMMTSTSTTLDHFHQSHTTSESAFGPTQSQRHSSPSVLSGTLVPQLLPPTASDSSETVTPAGSTNQQLRTVPPEQPNIISAINNMNLIRSVPEYTNLEHILTPNTTTRQHPPVSSPKSKHQKPNGALLQQLHPSQDLESLQQQVLLIQQQREMDRVEYERMEQVHKERTQWMKAEIDRTQSKLLELAASKRATMSSQQYVDDLPPSHANDAENGYCNDAGNPTASTFQKQQYEQHHSSTNSTPFRSQKSTKSSVNLGRLSRSSSKASNGGGSSSSGGQSNRLKGEAQLKHDKLGRDAVAQQWDSSTADFMTASDQPAYTIGNISRQSSGRKSQHSQQDRPQHYQEDLPPQTTSSTPRSRPREQRPRSKSTESRPPINPENDNYSDPNDKRLYARQPSRPQSYGSRRRRHHQRSVSVERPYSYYYDSPYFYPPTGALEVDMENDDEMDTVDEDEAYDDDYRYPDIEHRYPQQQQHHHQQRYDSFPPRHQQRMRSYYPQSPYMPGPMTFLPPPPPLGQPPPIYRQRMTPSQMQQDFYGYDGPPSYYSNAAPPTRRRQPPTGVMSNDDGYWPHSTGGGGGHSSFNRCPPPQVIPHYMRMDDPQRQAYWRSRPPPHSEYTM